MITEKVIEFIVGRMSFIQGPDDANDEYTAACKDCNDTISGQPQMVVIGWMKYHAEEHILRNSDPQRKVFYDFEFYENGETIAPISLGMVDNYGDELYVIFRDAPWTRIKNTHPWLVNNVIPLLPQDLSIPATVKNPFQLDFNSNFFMSTVAIRYLVEDFLRGAHKSSGGRQATELWAYYAAYDHVALAQLWGPMVDMPKDIPWYTNDLMTLWNQARCPKMPPQNHEHLAISDARWNLELFVRCQAELQK